MCGFCGYVLKENQIENDKIIKQMNTKLNFRNSTIPKIYIDQHTALSYSKLNLINAKNNVDKISKIVNQKEYIIIWNGELYNTRELKTDLISKGYTFDGNSDTEIVLTCYIHYKEKCVEFFNGNFAFAIYDKTNQNLFLARDRLGIKPLFYTFANNTFLFASQIKALLAHPDVKAVLDKEGIMELIGLGPAHTPGKTFFKGIFEIKPGHFANFKKFSLFQTEYWDLKTKECNDTEKEAILQIHDLVVDATKKQLVSNVDICSMLSGGLDSSILAKIAKDHIPNLTTFSIDYVGNETNFVSNDYQISKDSDYIKIMSKFLNTKHKNIMIENKYLFNILKDAMIARDLPGMADIDSSMYLFCNKITENGNHICLSGECSDEIFGGYPWYYKEHLISHHGFPWALSEDLRDSIIKKEIFPSKQMREYVENARQNTLKHVIHLEKNDEYEKRFRNTNYLTIKWFMNTLIERTERMATANSLIVRIPFADYRIFEYVYNLPARMKLGISSNNLPIEKYLLRKAFENELPKDVVYRKKSPFPKTYDPNYLKAVEVATQKILNDSSLKIHQIINTDFVQNMLRIHGENLTQNWFGQLMTYPQTLAYLIQISNWLETYDIEIEL